MTLLPDKEEQELPLGRICDGVRSIQRLSGGRKVVGGWVSGLFSDTQIVGVIKTKRCMRLDV